MVVLGLMDVFALGVDVVVVVVVWKVEVLVVVVGWGLDVVVVVVGCGLEVVVVLVLVEVFVRGLDVVVVVVVREVEGVLLWLLWFVTSLLHPSLFHLAPQARFGWLSTRSILVADEKDLVFTFWCWGRQTSGV